MGASNSRSRDDAAVLEELSALTSQLESSLRTSSIDTIGQLQMLEDKVTNLESIVKDVKAKRAAAAKASKAKRHNTAKESELVQSWLKPLDQTSPPSSTQARAHNQTSKAAVSPGHSQATALKVPETHDATDQDVKSYQRYKASTDKMRFFGPAYDVTLRSDDGKFGLSLVGAVSTDLNQERPDSGIFVRSLREGSPAALSGKLHVHDRVLKVNGADVMSSTQDEVVGLIRSSGKEVALTIAPFIKTKKSRKSLLVS
eukprot:m.222783 g.222783  ORF g.222783 m.222783 type:complete len:257 (+) comp17257_c1_seq4:445-1215(+)